VEIPWGRLEICKKSAEFQGVGRKFINICGIPREGVQKMDVLHRWGGGLKNAISHWLAMGPWFISGCI
jgi:hypothetical protein